MTQRHSDAAATRLEGQPGDRAGWSEPALVPPDAVLWIPGADHTQSPGLIDDAGRADTAVGYVRRDPTDMRVRFDPPLVYSGDR